MFNIRQPYLIWVCIQLQCNGTGALETCKVISNWWLPKGRDLIYNDVLFSYLIWKIRNRLSSEELPINAKKKVTCCKDQQQWVHELVISQRTNFCLVGWFKNHSALGFAHILLGLWHSFRLSSCLCHQSCMEECRLSRCATNVILSSFGACLELQEYHWFGKHCYIAPQRLGHLDLTWAWQTEPYSGNV